MLLNDNITSQAVPESLPQDFIVDLLEVDNSDWHRFVMQSSGATVFHHPAWTHTVAGAFGYRGFIAVLKDRSGRIVGGTPLTEIDSWLTGKRWVSLAFTDYCSPLLTHGYPIDQLYDGIVSISNRLKIPSVEMRFRAPANHFNSGAHTFYLHHLRLNRDEDELFRQFRKKGVQYCIKKGLKEGIRIELTNDYGSLAKFYGLHSLTRRKLGVPVQPKQFFDILWKRIIHNDLGIIALAYSNDRVIAGGIFLHFNKTIVYKYGATDPSYMHTNGNHVLLWDVIRWSSRQGFETMDWGRTDMADEGLRHFKRGWGTEETEVAYSYIGRLPKRQSSGMSKKLLGTIIRHSPLLVTRVMGELLYRHVG